jgi:tetratricopeptide (TPR) repeat protein
MTQVQMKREPLTLPTYGVGQPEKNPMFFEKRVYQGSSGKVYPVPFIDKVHDTPHDRAFDSVLLENKFVRLRMLPEIGGRIFLGQDKVNQDYDFFYRQDGIKPALVGLAGPWISGGVEFNWPQHHRPGTYMPTDVSLEEGNDGSHTVWMSEHDPLHRMKGMHGICLHPDSAVVELKARLYNRTPLTRTFLWWANIAAEVHDDYQSFFPPDVHYVADHAVRAQSSFPIANNPYYGVDYAARPGANDLSWYKNIPVPTSYMVCETDFEFFGGYDFAAEGGFVHVADKHISPGKKQWTWGNHEFGWAWDRELTDRIGRTGRAAPYVELMAGVYTDNQPDFSYLLPYETKTFSQYWWPYQKIGPVQNANRRAAVRLVVREDRSLDLGAVASERLEGAQLVVRDGDRTLLSERIELSPEQPWQNRELMFEGDDPSSLSISIEGIISYRPVEVSRLQRNREVATEPPLPEEVTSSDELFFIAEHLEQYRHPTRSPELYWREALRRDPLDARVRIAMGRHELHRGCFEEAGEHLEQAVRRLTSRHPNPCNGEAHYTLGVVRRFQNRLIEAEESFQKACWNGEWRSAAHMELAFLVARQGRTAEACQHCDAALETNAALNKAKVLKALMRKKEGQTYMGILEDLLAVDPLDHWARIVSGDVEVFMKQSRNDAQTLLDLVYEFADAGLKQEAVDLLELHHAHPTAEVAVPNPLQRSPLTHYALAWLKQDTDLLARARAMSPDYLFPSRLHDQVMLEWAVNQEGEDVNAAYGLGNFYYDKKRHEEAIDQWESVTPFPTLCRNLGIAYWNVRQDGEAARAAYQKALELDPADARIFAEYDQLREKLGDDPEARLEELLARPDLVDQRDDASVALAGLYNRTGSPAKALGLLLNRRFHPWEGGEGKVLEQYTTARLLLGQQALKDGRPEQALEQFDLAMTPPENLGEAYHLLQAKADVSYWKGMACRACGREEEAVAHFEACAAEEGDFLGMEVTEYSERSHFRVRALRELGREDEADALQEKIGAFEEKRRLNPPGIDYFATSLPQLLVFEDYPVPGT